MNREEIIQLIKDNLRIEVNQDFTVDYGVTTGYADIRLYFDGELISSDTITL